MSYQPLLVLAAGTLVFFGFAGIGDALARAAGLTLPSPWRLVCAVLLGIQCVALCVELAAMAGQATHPLLLAFGWALLATGAFTAVGILSWPRMPREPMAVFFALIVAAALLSGLLTAMAPSSKVDEIYYHMLAPARIAAEGALVFYREPWEAAVWPQMAFQVALAPLHALGLRDAGNVAGWWLGAALAYFAWKIVAEARGEAPWPYAWAAALCVGLYPAIWHATAGSHAMGDLALAAATVTFLRRETLLAQAGPLRLGALVSVLALGAASSKISLLPVSALLVAMTLASLGSKQRAWTLLAMAAPWLVFYAPIVAWTAWASGSPFGPVLGDWFPGSLYGDGTMRQVFAETREANVATPAEFAFDLLAGYSPLVWVGMLGALLCREIAPRDRIVAAALLAAQLFLIALFLFPGVRFLGGLHYGLAIAFAAACAAPVGRRLAIALLVPWLGIQVYYSAQFFPVSLGLQEDAAFRDRYVAFNRDFEALDRLLPADAVLLCDFRLGSVYAPRPVFFDSADLPRGRPAYALVDPAEPDSAALLLGRYRRMEVVYRNERAISEAYRTPGRANRIGPLEVVRLAP